MAFEAKKRKYKNLPIHAISTKKYNDKTSNGLTTCIIDHLRLEGWQAERISVTGRYVGGTRLVTDVIGRTKQIGSAKWISPSMQVGTADIACTIQGRSVKIEVKIGRDRQSQKQIEYQHQVERAGGIYYIAKDFESFYNWYQKLVNN